MTAAQVQTSTLSLLLTHYLLVKWWDGIGALAGGSLRKLVPEEVGPVPQVACGLGGLIASVA